MSSSTRRAPRAADAAANRFLVTFLSDREAGCVRALADYEAMFPGFENRIAEEHARVIGVSEDRGAQSGSGPRVGARLGPYVLVDELGRGGQGSVWRADDTQLGRSVAIKIIAGTASWRPDAVERFRREATLASRLEHPGICAVLDADLDGPVPYVAMRLVQGKTLQQVIDEHRARATPIDPREVARIVEDAARALHIAHESGVVHRDVKPANIMLTPDEQVVVLDFGIASDADVGGSTMTASDELFGTPTYMAPEQIEGARASRASDVWGLGVTLYEVLALELPFRAPTREALYRAVLEHEPAPPRQGMGGVSRDLEVIVQTALAKELPRRYATALDLAEDLAAWRQRRPIRARRLGVIGRLARWVRREPLRATLASGLVVTALVAAWLVGFIVARSGELSAGARALAEQSLENLIRDVSRGHLTESEADHRFVAILDEQPGLSSHRATYMAYLASTGRAEDALAVYARAPAAQDDARAVERARALVLRSMGKTREASEIERPLGEPQTALESYHASRSAHRASGRRARLRAYHLARRCVYLSKKADENYLGWLVDLAIEQRKFNEARLAADSLEKHFPESALAAFYVSKAWLTADPKRARAAVERARDLDPSKSGPYLFLHNYAMQDGDHDAAKRLFEQAMARVRHGSARWHHGMELRAGMCLAIRRCGDALEVSTRALAADPDRISQLLLQARALRGLDRENDAQIVLSRVLALDPNNDAARRLVGGK